MKKNYISMKELMSVLQPVKTCGFMAMCARFKTEIEEASESGEEYYEIAGRYTRNGNPYVIFFR